MKKVLVTGIVSILPLLCFFTDNAFGEPTVEDLQVEIQKLTTQMELMQSQMQSQIEGLQEKLDELKALDSGVQAAGTPSVTESVFDKITTSSKYDVKLYGKIKADYIYDTKDLGSDEFIKYIPSNPDERSRSTYTLRETRLGLDIIGPSFNDWQTHGVIETDFYGSGANIGSGSLRIRRSFINLSKNKVDILAGQDWLPVGSMNPDTLNFGVMGYSGNLWDRVPQLTFRYKVNSAITGTITTYRHRFGDDKEQDLPTEFKLPWFGTKIAYENILFDAKKKAFFALSGAVREGEVGPYSVTPNLAVFEFKVPYEIFELKGEVYRGKGLGVEYYHSDGAFNLNGQEISTEGGFVQLGIKPIEFFHIYTGYGVNNPHDGDIVNDEFYQENHYLFGNLYYTIVKDIRLGLEVTRLKTYWDTDDEQGVRFQSSVIFLW